MASIRLRSLVALVVGSAAIKSGFAYAADHANLNKIEILVVIYAENRSFDNLYGHFPEGKRPPKMCPPKWPANSTATARR